MSLPAESLLPLSVLLPLSLANLSDLALNRDRKLVAAESAHPGLVVVVAAALLYQSESLFPSAWHRRGVSL